MVRKALPQLSVAENLCQLARTYKSGDPGMSAQLKHEFKELSKNDIVRSCIYLMEVVGSRDAQFKKLQEDNADLTEILKLNEINLDEEFEKLEKKENTGTTGAPSTDSLSAAATKGVEDGTAQANAN